MMADGRMCRSDFTADSFRSAYDEILMQPRMFSTRRTVQFATIARIARSVMSAQFCSFSVVSRGSHLVTISMQRSVIVRHSLKSITSSAGQPRTSRSMPRSVICSSRARLSSFSSRKRKHRSNETSHPDSFSDRSPARSAIENDSSMSQMANAFSSRLTPVMPASEIWWVRRLCHVVENVLYRQVVDAVRAAAKIEHDQVAELERHLRKRRVAHVRQQTEIKFAHIASIVGEQAAHQPRVRDPLAVGEIDVPQFDQTLDRRYAVVGDHPAAVEDERFQLRYRLGDLNQGEHVIDRGAVEEEVSQPGAVRPDIRQDVIEHEHPLAGFDAAKTIGQIERIEIRCQLDQIVEVKVLEAIVACETQMAQLGQEQIPRDEVAFVAEHHLRDANVREVAKRCHEAFQWMSIIDELDIVDVKSNGTLELEISEGIVPGAAY
uniref:Uncharacterized protein n=1 Tax=Anopheles farauti TaxID=69004 RepID=A0A182QNN0_9DIPT